ncbi:MAG: PfkB family carbohydrate kinase [Puniceicoccales bacterium]|jgi:sugar/nucleoside kinase (ribokinase family)|nr:PfkB family carbohydrate kinase [Puniceicoccales bacterium]
MRHVSLPVSLRANPSESAPLLVSGTVAYDDILTPTDSGEHLLGGSASYAALAASHFTTVRIASIVGADFAAADRERFLAREIDTAALQTDTSGDTFFWRGRYHDNFNTRDTLETRLGVNAHPRAPLPAGHETTPYVLLANDAPAIQLDLLAQMRSPRLVAADSMNLWIETDLARLRHVISKIHLFIVNDSEAAQLTGERNPVRAGHALLSFGARAAIVKKGEHGTLLFHPDGLFALPAFPVTELRDSTGAGDSFAGALAASLAVMQREDFDAIKTAMLYATATASLSIEAFSCNKLEAASTTAEIEARSAFLREMTRLPSVRSSF